MKNLKYLLSPVVTDLLPKLKFEKWQKNGKQWVLTHKPILYFGCRNPRSAGSGLSRYSQYVYNTHIHDVLKSLHVGL